MKFLNALACYLLLHEYSDISYIGGCAVLRCKRCDKVIVRELK